MTANFIYIGDPEYSDIALRSVVLVVLSTVGLLVKIFFDQMVTRDKGPLFNTVFVSLDSMTANTILVWTGIGIAGIFILSLFSGTGAAGSYILPYFIFGTVGAIGEELFFLSVQINFYNVFKYTRTFSNTPIVRDIISVFLITILFSYFHIVVYSGDIYALIYVTGLRVICSIIYQITRRPSIPIIIHLINNVLSISGIL